MLRGEYKTPGGKLVAVTIAVDGGGAVCSVRLDGDFFVESVDGSTAADTAADALLRDIERALAAGEPVAPAVARHPGARLIGTDARAIETAWRRALGEAPHAAAGMHGRMPERDLCDIHGNRDVRGREREYDIRWSRLLPELAVIRDRPRTPGEQMSIDVAWARQVAAGTRPPTLRFWEWAAPCVVVGRFQSIRDEVHEEVARAEGFEVVRRATGGGAMFIEPGNTITYSLYAPAAFVRGLDVAESYRLCDRWLVDALRELGLDVGFSGLNDIASPAGKIGGAAQRRFPAPRGSGGSSGPGAVLHHTTLAYDIDAERMSRVLNVSGEKLSDKAVRSARRRVDPLRSQTGMGRDALVDHLIGALRRVR